MKNKRMQFLIAGGCIWGIAACGALVMSAQSQKEEKEQSALEEWIGTYKFLESTPHAAASDFFDTWSYSIEIYREKGEYYAALEFNGHMLWIEGRAKVCGNEERIDLIFEQYSPGDVSSTAYFDEGDLLLSFEKEGEKLLTVWGEMKPALLQNEPDGNIYFVKKSSE